MVQKQLIDKLALRLLEGEFAPGDTVRVDAGDGELDVRAAPPPATGRRLAVRLTAWESDSASARRAEPRRRLGGHQRPTATTTATCSTLRDELSAGTLRGLEQLDAKPAASAEDRWQRRVEYLFERLAVRWEIAGLPLEGQKELLGRYRMASAEERARVRAALAEHLRARYPDVDV